MWGDIEARIAENERDGVVPLRRTLLAEIFASGLRPGQSTTKKFVPLETVAGERLVWQIEGTAQNFYLHRKWTERAEVAGYGCTPLPHQQGQKDGARHSVLGRDWAFGTADCVEVRVDSADALKGLIRLVEADGDSLVLDPLAVERWIGVIRKSFPDFRQFDTPDVEFDEKERNDKLETAMNLRAALNAAASDQEIAAAVLKAAGNKSSNLLDWRTYLPLMPTGDGDKSRLEPALARLARAALASPEGHGAALDEFATIWQEAVPKASDDPPRQIAEFLFFHLWPDTGSYIRKSVRQDLWREAIGSRFPSHESMSETYTDELRFMRAVRAAFTERGLAPRDMIDVQSALWVVSKYQDEGMVLERQAIEGAMDALDRHREGVEKSELLDRFGNPQDYWVLSSRERPNRIYPSKPIVGYLRRTNELNGGWGQKNDTAALLHEAGYVIVGEKGDALPLPEPYTHLDRGTDHARKCARNYFIEPIRELGKYQATIRVGELCALMGQSLSLGVVSEALSDKGFPTFARAALVERIGQPGSENETFSFTLEQQTGEREIMTSEKDGRAALATNLILYGPPGTGKTYRTAWEAVRLCMGDVVAEGLQGSDNRDALMAEYRRLVEAQRIEFVTFHQSLSYEEFIEGLRPSTGEDPIEGLEVEGGKPGFSLKPNDGVFKRICERAIRDLGDLADPNRLDRSRRIIRLGLTGWNWREKFDLAIAEGCVEWPHAGETDWSPPEYDSWEAIKARRMLEEPNVFGGHPTVYGTWLFRGTDNGEYIALTVGKARIVAFGRFSGDYSFKPAANGNPPRHIRPVEWLWHSAEGVDRAGVYAKDFTSFHTAYPLLEDQLNWDALDRIVYGTDVAPQREVARPFVLIIDEINRANISKVFGELITLLEPDKRLGMSNEICVTLPYSKKTFGVPANLHLIGTMNTADRSIALLDTALRRRFSFRELTPEPSALSDNVGGINLQELLRTINERIEYLFDREHQIGHAYFTGCATRDDVEAAMRGKVIPLLAEYFYEDWSKVATVLGDTKQDKPRFLVREDIKVPDGMEVESHAGPRYRWRVKPERDGGGNGGFDFSEFEAL